MTLAGRILIVEDDFDIRDTLSQLLSFEGYEVAGAADGAEALAFLREARPPALILLDLMMPVMDGWDFHAALRRDVRLSDVPVVILSADGRIEQAAVQLGAAGYLKKPIRLEQLLDVVERYCGFRNGME